MCGRFSQLLGSKEIEEEFNVKFYNSKITNSYNIAPTQFISTIKYSNEGYIYSNMLWNYGLSYSNSQKRNFSIINARDDSLHKNLYHKAINSTRCIIPISGFYEWKKSNGIKQPYHIHFQDYKPMALGGIFSAYEDSNKNIIESVAIITTSPSKQMSEIHNRMPLIINKSEYKTWLDSNNELSNVSHIIKPNDKNLVIDPVSTFVNSPKNNTKECINKINISNNKDNQLSLDDF